LSYEWHCFCTTKASDEWHAHANAVAQPAMIDLVRDAFEQGKIVAAGCHAGWMLVSVDIVRGKRVACFASIKDNMINAGGRYEDTEVVHDGN
jgi:protease I